VQGKFFKKKFSRKNYQQEKIGEKNHFSSLVTERGKKNHRFPLLIVRKKWNEINSIVALYKTSSLHNVESYYKHK